MPIGVVSWPVLSEVSDLAERMVRGWPLIFRRASG
jgi:hypothetical protein